MTGTGLPPRFALRWATFACDRERRLDNLRRDRDLARWLANRSSRDDRRPPPRFALRWATFACDRERRLDNIRRDHGAKVGGGGSRTLIERFSNWLIARDFCQQGFESERH